MPIFLDCYSLRDDLLRSYVGHASRMGDIPISWIPQILTLENKNFDRNIVSYNKNVV